MKRNAQMRPSKEFTEIINFIRAKYLLAGKTPPTITKITKIIAKRIDKQRLLHEEFIRL